LIYLIEKRDMDRAFLFWVRPSKQIPRFRHTADTKAKEEPQMNADERR